MKIIDGNNMLHMAADKVGLGIHPAREVYNKFVSPDPMTIIVWDSPSGNARRKKIFPQYKAKRVPPEESKKQFFAITKAVLQFTPVIQIECKGWEADDVIGTLIKKYWFDHDITVMTTDGDYWQHHSMCNLPMVSKKWRKFSESDCLLYKSLVGEEKDNIMGLPKFGQVSWDKLDFGEKLVLKQAILEDNFTKFKNATNWPKRIKIDEENFQHVRLCFMLNKYWTVPDEEIDRGTRVGVLNTAAAEQFMSEYMI